MGRVKCLMVVILFSWMSALPISTMSPSSTMSPVLLCPLSLRTISGVYDLGQNNSISNTPKSLISEKTLYLLRYADYPRIRLPISCCEINFKFAPPPPTRTHAPSIDENSWFTLYIISTGTMCILI